MVFSDTCINQHFASLSLSSSSPGMDSHSGTYGISGSSSGANSPTLSAPEIKQQNNQNAVISSSDEAINIAINKLCERSNYPIIQENGQRRYGPPPDWKGVIPNRGCEVFIGKIPRDCFEDELVPIFEKVGKVYMFRLMMDFSGSNRGYGFCIYTNREDTKRAVQQLDNFEIRSGKMLGVCLSVDNCRLFVGGIPKMKTKNEIMVEMKKVTEGVQDVIVYPSAGDKAKNRGFAFVEYEHHKAAAMARRKLIPGRIQLWGHQIAVDWAEPEKEVDEEVMSKVKILYVRNLMLTTTEEHLRELFTAATGGVDVVERVKKIRDYAFIHFKDRHQALQAMIKLDDTEIDGSRVEVTLAKPADKSDQARYTRGNQKMLSQLASVTTPQPTLAYSIDPFTFAYYPHLAATAAPNPGAISPRLLQAGTNGSSGTPSRSESPQQRGGGGAYRNRPFRNAAGSRSAGARNTPGYLREKKTQVELLEELCSRNGLNAPHYHVQTHELLDPTTGAKSNWFLGRVTVIISQIPRMYSANRFTQTTEEAKIAAADAALIQLSQPYAAASQFSFLDPSMAAAASNFAALPIHMASQAVTSAAGDIPATFLYTADPSTAFMNSAAFMNNSSLGGTEIYTHY